MRGTGCSGGAFDFFEPLQSLDGYDVIETIARQPWVAHHKVGMMGISYGGISQLFTAQTQPAEPRRDLAAVGDRRHADDALSRAASSTPASPSPGRKERIHDAKPRRPERRAAVGLQADPGGRHRPARPTRRCTARRPTCWRRSARTTTTCRRSPTRSRRSRSSTRSTCRSFMACQCDGRADRRPLPDAGRALHRHAAEVVHVHQRHPRRLARPGDLQPLVRLPRALRRQAGADRRTPRRSRPRAPVIYQEAMGIAGRDAAARPDPAAADLRRRRWPRSSSCRRSGCCSTTAPAARSPAQPLPRLRAVVPELPDPGHHGAHRGTSAPAARSRDTRAGAAPAPTRSPGTRTPGR